MSTTPLEELYFVWLYEQVGAQWTNPRNTYWDLARQLYSKEFIWFVPNDDNRVLDGIELRHEFIDRFPQARLGEVDSAWLEIGCSMLEMLIAFSRVLAFEGEGEPREWFWVMLENADLKQFTDARYLRGRKKTQELVDEYLDMIIWRRFASNGEGGLFPLENPTEDQRKTELWYQASAYLLEQYE